MANRKPHGGYPTRTAYACAQYEKGVSVSQIAREFGVTPATVYRMVAGTLSYTTLRRRQIAEINKAMAPAANARLLKVQDLKHRLLLSIAREPVLIDNILDDGAGQ